MSIVRWTARLARTSTTRPRWPTTYIDGSVIKMMSNYYYYNFDGVLGKQFLVSMDPSDGNFEPKPDDWLISPQVPGGSVVEFYYGALVRKTQGVEFYYSETGHDISDFKLLNTLEDATGDDWFFAYIKLPETAKYFAIRHSKTANMAYGLKIDDITYNMLTAVDHFNIYVDGQLVGTSAEVAYTIDGRLESGAHKVAVTAVYADGTESVPAYATLDYDASGIEELMAGKKNFDVYSVDGKLLRSNTSTVDGLNGVFVIDKKKVVLK